MNKYQKGDKVRTIYGVGKVIDIGSIEHVKGPYYAYKIRYSIFKRPRWCFEDAIEGVVCDNDDRKEN